MRSIKSLNDSITVYREYSRDMNTDWRTRRNYMKYLGQLKYEKRMARRKSSGKVRGSR